MWADLALCYFVDDDVMRGFVTRRSAFKCGVIGNTIPALCRLKRWSEHF